MITANHNRSLDDAFPHQFVKGQSGLIALTIAQPADTRGQALKMYLLPGQLNPAFQRLIVREQLQNGFVGAINVFGIAGEGNPTEGAFAATEKGTNIGGDKARVVQRMLLASRQSLSTQIVAIVKNDGSSLL